MPDYIDRKKLIKYIHDNGKNFCITEANRWNFSEIARMVKSEDVAPVVHGRWGMHSDRPDTLICSICDHAFDVWKHDIDRMHYCPNCGSKMDLKR